MDSNFDFKILPKGVISNLFLENDIKYFEDASKFIQDLDYRRNSNKTDIAIVIKEKCGTCSTKHSILKQLAIENKIEDLKLILGIFNMKESNFAGVGSILNKYMLTYLPEAHNYLKYGNSIIDITKKNWSIRNYLSDLTEEIEIEPNQITEFKVIYYKAYLKNWLSQNSDIKYNLEEIWKIREESIANISI